MMPATAPLAPISGSSEFGIIQEWSSAGEDPAHQIEHDEAHMAHGVLDIVAEHPEEQHVAEQMDPAAVQEHVGDQREALRHMKGDIMVSSPRPGPSARPG